MKTLFSILWAFFACLSLTAQETPVKESELPAEAKSFIKDHFKSPVHHAIKDVERNKITYEVVLDDHTEIEFTEAGRWTEVDGKAKAIPLTFVQKAILDYVKMRHPKDRITKIQRKDSGYEAELNTGTDLKFDARGTFIKMN